MELQTRLAFIDTSAFEKKNYQFGQYALGRLQELIEDEKIHLLITDVTRKEIDSHLKRKSEEAASMITKLQKDGMFLRNTPNLDCHGIFTKVKGEDIYTVVSKKFDDFVENGYVETINVSIVNPQLVFDAYFNNHPPFGKESKKHEFPDAFALEAIKQVSLARGNAVYIVSDDGDMKSFCEKEDNFIHLEKVDDLIDLIVRSDKAYKEPAEFADEVFEQLLDQIKVDALQAIKDGEFNYEHADPFDDIINSIEINSLNVEKKSLQNVGAEGAEYEVEFEVVVTAEYQFSDYDRSPWDPEDKQYVFILSNESIVKHKETYTAHITLAYPDGLKANAHIEELYFQDTYFELTDGDSEVISFKELDINGE
ncbi:PIN domain-containing protein [Aeromonas caviae]|uniref:PIN domain-containing protein n=1 Tax=Aeromonas caviae TaxID=648 RepID=UPI002B47B9B0|nr:PIN domain-containing protein [Aeromonas caviae]